MNQSLLNLGVAMIFASCARGSYVDYLADPVLEVDEQLLAEDETQRMVKQAPTEYIKVSFNDGQTLSQVEIPILSAGQKFIIKNRRQVSHVEGKTHQGPTVIVPGPEPTDSTHRLLETAYTDKGLAVNKSAQPVSLTRAQKTLKSHFQHGEYVQGLQIVEKVLGRYPSHPEFLRAKGTLLARLGETEKAIEIYEKAQDIEYVPSVEQKIINLRGE